MFVGIFALILTPTRELACQIGDQFLAFSQNTGFRFAMIYGGSGMITNTGELEERPNVVIATPGRLVDLIDSGTEFPCDELKYLVIDEADQLLCHRNFIKDLSRIFKYLPKPSQRQTLLFSATLDTSMNQIYKILKLDFKNSKKTKDSDSNSNSNPSNSNSNSNSNDNNNDNNNNSKKKIVEFIEASTFNLSTVKSIYQTYAFVPEMSKETYLITMLLGKTDFELNNTITHSILSDKSKKQISIEKQRQLEALTRKNEKYNLRNKSMIIFISSREYAMIMSSLLKKFNLKVSELHGNMKQKRRLNELLKFRSGKSKILIATDLASRGLDIPQVEYVINFDIPRIALDYVHRIGRCGRVDRHGTSITFVSQYDINLLHEIENHIGLRMKAWKTDIYDKTVVLNMEKVLIARSGIINAIETKYLTDPAELKKHPSLRWNGKFTDPRLNKINGSRNYKIEIEKNVIANANTKNRANDSDDDDDDDNDDYDESEDEETMNEMVDLFMKDNEIVDKKEDINMNGMNENDNENENDKKNESNDNNSSRSKYRKKHARKQEKVNNRKPNDARFDLEANKQNFREQSHAKQNRKNKRNGNRNRKNERDLTLIGERNRDRNGNNILENSGFKANINSILNTNDGNRGDNIEHNFLKNLSQAEKFQDKKHKKNKMKQNKKNKNKNKNQNGNSNSNSNSNSKSNNIDFEFEDYDNNGNQAANELNPREDDSNVNMTMLDEEERRLRE